MVDKERLNQKSLDLNHSFRYFYRIEKVAITSKKLIIATFQSLNVSQKIMLKKFKCKSKNNVKKV